MINFTCMFVNTVNFAKATLKHLPTMKQIVAKTAPAASPCLRISYGINVTYGTCSQKNAITKAAINDAIDPILDEICESSLADEIDSM